MDNCCCLICNENFNRIFDIKKHLSSTKHHWRKREIFKKDILKTSGVLPYIIVFRVIRNRPFVGLSMLTFCCSLEENVSFYLCHVCGEKCPPPNIITHVLSKSHYSNYLNYTDPDSLNFAWTPSVDAHTRIILCTSRRMKLFANGSGQLQVLDLPADLLKVLETRIYSEVMQSLNENEELLMLMKGSTPKRVTIQTYLKDGQRKHPLLGLQHLIECACTGNPAKAYYLCTLCRLSLPSLMIIKHILSFDHIHAYFKALHPSTLLSKDCYRDYSETFSLQMLDLAKQSEEMNPTLDTDIKQVIMEPDVFASVNFASFTQAMKMLLSITSDSRKSSLTPVVKAGKMLEFRDTSAAAATSASCPASADSAMPETSAGSPDSTAPAAGSSAACPAPAKPPLSAEPRASKAPKRPAPVNALSHDIRCQNCSTNFNSREDYCKHLATTGHKNMLEKCFKVQGATKGPEPKEWTHRIGLFIHLEESLRTNMPVVGVPLIVTCISTEADVKPFYLCFACKDCFNESRLTRHLNATKHLIHVLLYHNPWRLPFAWENELDVTLLRLTAMEEEKERGPDLMLMKILDVPYRIFFKFCHSFEKVMTVLQLYHTLLMHAVPRRETYRKLNKHDRFPLLGQEFLVMHHMSELQYEDTIVVFLCLLCERTLSTLESYAHVFSREHITTFLEKFHPGTLNSDTASELLDLARQAARIHPVSHVQVIRGEWPTGKPYTYQNAKSVLTSLKYKKGRGYLLPQIVPNRKLVPRISTEHVDLKGCLQNIQNGPEMQTCPKHLHCSDTGNKINRPSGENPTSSENEPKNEKVLVSQSCSEQIKNECSDTLQQIMEEKTAVPIKREQAETPLESFSNVAHDIEVKAEVKRMGPESESPENLVGTTHGASPGKGLTTVKSAEGMSSEENMEKYRPRQDFNLKPEPFCEELLTLPSIRKEEENTDGATGPSQKTVTGTGISESEDQAQQNIHAELKPTAALFAVQPMGNVEVVNMEIEKDAEPQGSSVNESAVVESESTSDTPDIPTKIKAPASTSNVHLSFFQSDKELLTPVDLTHSTRLKHDARGNGSNANVIPNPTAAHRASVTFEMERRSLSEKNASYDITASTNSAIAGTSCRFRRPSSSNNTAKAHSSCRSSSSSSASIAIQKSKETWCKLAATTTKRPATSSDSSRCSKMSKSFESEVKSQTWRKPPTATASVEHGGTEASPEPLKNSVQTNTDVSPECTPEAPHSTSQVSIKSVWKNPTCQPSCDSVSKPTKRAPGVGLNQLIVVSCQSKRQVYCKLCSVKVSRSSHVTEDGHKHNYVKRFFGVTDKLLPDVLDKVVSGLSEVERNLGSRTCQRLAVNMDTYKELRNLPASKALATLKKMLAPKDSRVFSTVTQISPDEEMEAALKQDTSKAVDQTDRIRVTRSSETTESAGQLPSCRTSSRNDVAGPTDVPDAETAAQKMDARRDGRNRPAACIGIRRQLERSTGDLQVKELLSGPTDRSFGKMSSLDSFHSASGIADQQNRQRSDHTSKPVPESSVKNKGVSVAKSHSLSRISIGERIHASSNLSVLLMVHQTPIVGLSSIWECRGISSSQLPSFFLCESCVERLPIELICKHMNSTSHQLAHLTEHYPRDMLFWGEKDLSHMAKLSGLKDVVSLLSKHESYAKMDAQVVLLREDLYKCIQDAPVSEALKLVQSITRGPNPELSKALHEYVESKKAEKHLMDEDQRGKMLSSTDVVGVSGKTGTVVSSVAGANAPPAPQELVKKRSLEPEAKVSLHKKSVPESSSSSVSPQKGVTSRPANESLVTPHNIKAQPDASVPQSETQPGTGSVFESKQTGHASTSTLLFYNNKDGSQTQEMFSVHQAECINLISLVKNLKHGDENASSQKSVETSCLQPPSQMKRRRWNSEKREVAVKPALPSAPSVVPKEDQLVGYAAPPEELAPYSVGQPRKAVHSENTERNESQVTSSPGAEAKHISVQISRPRSAAETDGNAVCQRSLNYAEANGGHGLARPCRSVSAPAPGHYGWCDQTGNNAHGQVSSSAEAASSGSNTLGVFHVNQISAEREAKGFGHWGSQTAPGGVGLEVQQQQMQQQMQQILQLLHQQQILQQHLQSQVQQQQLMHQYQMQQPPTYQVHLYQSNGEQVQQQHQMQPLIYQYQTYPQQMRPSDVHQLQQSNQDQGWQPYGQYGAGTSAAANQSSLPLSAGANVERNIHRISLAQHNNNLVMRNISSTSHGEHYPSLSTNPQDPGC